MNKCKHGKICQSDAVSNQESPASECCVDLLQQTGVKLSLTEINPLVHLRRLQWPTTVQTALWTGASDKPEDRACFRHLATTCEREAGRVTPLQCYILGLFRGVLNSKDDGKWGVLLADYDLRHPCDHTVFWGKDSGNPSLCSREETKLTCTQAKNNKLCKRKGQRSVVSSVLSWLCASYHAPTQNKRKKNY
eukprot:scpid16130/ scgid7505/ 